MTPDEEIAFGPHFVTRPRAVEMLIDQVVSRRPIYIDLGDGTRLKVKLTMVQDNEDGTITFRVARDDT